MGRYLLPKHYVGRFDRTLRRSLDVSFEVVADRSEYVRN
jgi:hypothetical protein